MAGTPLAGRRAIVLGLGRFGGGFGAARFLLEQGADVLVTDRARDLGAAAAPLAALGAKLVLGSHEGVDFTDADLLVVNPAVPLDAPPVAAARAAGVALRSEIGLLIEHWPGPVVGITGSNGKSTTTSLVHAILSAAGRRARLGGNIGGSLLDDLHLARTGDVAVLEISSFMLDLLEFERLGPGVAAIINITPNHLDRHGSMQAYVQSKGKILAHARRAVFNADDEHVLSLAGGYRGTSLWFGGGLLPGARRRVPGAPRPDLHVGPEGDLIDRRDERVLADADIPLPGRANRLDLACATLVAAAVLSDEVRAVRALPTALQHYERPPHRMQTVGTWGGVSWIDDSVSTTPESTRASLQALGLPCLLIVGGHDKGLDPEPLLDGARRWARHVFTIGEQGPALLAALARRGVTAEMVGTVPAAVARAARLARPGEAVLLSPGYSSHDQFTNYEERAAVFAREALAQGAAGRLSQSAG